MRPIALLAATGGAVLGAGLWALIANLTGYEIGYVAWAVGGLVGGAAAAAGGRGAGSGVLCAVLAVAAILGGKFVAFQSSSLPELRTEIAKMLTQEVYAETMEDAQVFSALRSDEVPFFMVQREYSTADSPGEIHPFEVAEFQKTVAPELRRLNTEKPPYEVWRDDTVDRAVTELKSQISPTEALKESIGLIDLIFGFLGIATAFRLGAQPSPSNMRT